MGVPHAWPEGEASPPSINTNSVPKRPVNPREFIDLFIERSRVYDLEHVRYPGMPQIKGQSFGYQYFLHNHHENNYNRRKTGPRTGASGIFVMSDHSGTHIDALSHQAEDLTLFGKLKVGPAVETPFGFTHRGAEEIGPLIARGVLIDLAAHIRDPMPESKQIALIECKRVLKSEKVSVRPKDVVLIRTGYGRFWNAPSKYECAPGVSPEVSNWLGRIGVLAVGADNLGWDLPGAMDPKTRSNFPGHLLLIIRKGIYIMEKLYLEELSRDKVYEFLFVGLPLKFKGATGAPLRPIAVVPK